MRYSVCLLCSVFFVGVLLIGAKTSMAQLTFDEGVQNFEPDVNTAEVEAIFHFTNTGDYALQITSVRSPGDVEVAPLSKKTFAPGQEGVILATFKLKNYFGELRREIRLKTDERDDNEITLTMNMDVPYAIRVDKQELVWELGGEAEAQTVRIIPAEDAVLKDVKASVLEVFDEQTFEVEVVPGGEGEAASVVVKPMDMSKPIRRVVRIFSTVGEGREQLTIIDLWVMPKLPSADVGSSPEGEESTASE